MTISHSELRRNASYDEIIAFSFAPSEPNTVNFSIEIAGEEELIELECDFTGTKSIYIYDQRANRVEVDITGETFASWSKDLKVKITELLSELADWEASMRKPGGAWDICLLDEPNTTLESKK